MFIYFKNYSGGWILRDIISDLKITVFSLVPYGPENDDILWKNRLLLNIYLLFEFILPLEFMLLLEWKLRLSRTEKNWIHFLSEPGTPKFSETSGRFLEPILGTKWISEPGNPFLEPIHRTSGICSLEPDCTGSLYCMSKKKFNNKVLKTLCW